MTDRMGYGSRLIYYREDDGWNTDPDPAVGHIVPLVDASGVRYSSEPIEAPIYMGDGMLPYDVVSGSKQVGGSLALGLEYEFYAQALAAFFGVDGYAQYGGGTNTMHHFFIPTATGATQPPSFQLQHEWLEGTDIYFRTKGNRFTGLSWEGAVSGYARYNADLIGSGTTVQTDLAGSKADNGYDATNYFDGQIKYTASGTTTTLTDVSAFRCALRNGAFRRDNLFASGVAGNIVTSKINGEVELGFPMLSGGSGPTGDLNFFNAAVNETDVDLDIVIANAPLSGGSVTKFVRYQFNALRFFPQNPSVGGAAGISYSQRGILRRTTDAKTAACYIFPTGGTYDVTSSTDDVLGIKIDGGSSIETTLTAGAARTATQVVADLAGNASLTAVADVDLYLGKFIRITSKTKGSTSSVQVVTGTTNTAHALFGCDGTARAGRSNCPLLISVFNGTSSAIIS